MVQHQHTQRFTGMQRRTTRAYQSLHASRAKCKQHAASQGVHVALSQVYMNQAATARLLEATAMGGLESNVCAPAVDSPSPTPPSRPPRAKAFETITVLERCFLRHNNHLHMCNHEICRELLPSPHD